MGWNEPDFCISATCNTLTLGLLSVQHVEEIFKKQNPVWKCEKEKREHKNYFLNFKSIFHAENIDYSLLVRQYFLLPIFCHPPSTTS